MVDCRNQNGVRVVQEVLTFTLVTGMVRTVSISTMRGPRADAAGRATWPGGGAPEVRPRHSTVNSKIDLAIKITSRSSTWLFSMRTVHTTLGAKY